jgi:hypothetical protein
VKILHDTSLFNLNLCDDRVSWKFGLKGIFSIKSVYNALTINETGRYHKRIRKRENP